jgi:uncharacterized protein (DUF2336 family)
LPLCGILEGATSVGLGAKHAGYIKMNQRLSMADVERLLSHPSPQAKIETAAKILAQAPQLKETPGELALAHQIIGRLAGDTELAVRQAIAWQIAHSPLLTDELAEKLARDVAAVAFPILRYAQLPEDLLVDVLQSHEPRKSLAVAGRKNLTAPVAEAVIATENVKAIAVLMGNSSAQVSDGALNKVLDKYGLITAVTGAMAHRPGLTAVVVERLVGLVAAGVRNYLVETHKIPREQVDELVRRGREAAMVELIAPITDRVDRLDDFLRALDEAGQLTPGFTFRALCAGEIQLFRFCLSIRGRLPLLAIDELLRDRGPLGLPALLRRCDIPMSLLPAFKSALHVWRESGYTGEPMGRSAFQASVVAAVFEDCTPIDDVELDALLQNLFGPQPTVQAA